MLALTENFVKEKDRAETLSSRLVAVFLLEVTVQQALQSLAVTGLVPGHLVDGLQNAAFQAAYLQGRGWLICIDILSFQRKLRNIFLLEMCELSLNFGTSPVHLLTSF